MLPREKVLEVLLELSDRKSGRSVAALGEKALRAAIALADCDGAALLVSLQRRTERTVLSRAMPEPRPADSHTPSALARLLHRTGAPLDSPDLSEDPRAGEQDSVPGLDAGPALFAPVRLREAQPGYLAVYRRRGEPRFGGEEAAAIMLLAAWTAQAFDGAKLAESLEKLAVTDDLTQVYNYRFLKTALRREIKRAGRYSQELAIVMIDVDNLKGYNDRNGHLRGSFLLKETAGLLASKVRSFDLVAKYGGDEFTLILPQTGREGAIVVAERVRQTVAEHTFPLAPAGSITISSGVAVFPHDATDSIGLIQASDRALYLAKKRGRNRVETLEPEAEAA
jgi:diguanylate cyclase (GGDEF)-like protein